VLDIALSTSIVILFLEPNNNWCYDLLGRLKSSYTSMLLLLPINLFLILVRASFELEVQGNWTSVTLHPNSFIVYFSSASELDVFIV